MTTFPRETPSQQQIPSRRPLLIAHRGGAPHEVDNSAAAFEHALGLDIDMLEFDLRQAADGTLVLWHDPVLHVDGRRWVVQDTPYDLLRRFVPTLLTLDEWLERFGQALPFNLDLKTHGFETEVFEALARHDLAESALISCGHVVSLRRLAARSDVLRLGLSRGHARTAVEFRAFVHAYECYMGLLLPIMLRLSRAHAAMLHHQSIDAPLVERLHASGYRVFAWTVDDAKVARSLAEIGVDGIASNYPARIRDVLRRRAGT